MICGLCGGPGERVFVAGAFRVRCLSCFDRECAERRLAADEVAAAWAAWGGAS